MLDGQGPSDGRVPDPEDHLLRRLSSRRWSPTPTWCCPTPPISSATTASRCSTGRSPSPTRPQDAIRWPVVEPDRDVRGLPDGADRPRRAARSCRPSIDAGRQRRSTATMPTTSCATSAGPASGRWPAGAARTATATGAARPIPTSSSATSRTAAFFTTQHARWRRTFFKPPTAPIRTWRWRMGFFDTPQPVRLPALLGAAAEVPAGRPRQGRGASRPRHLRETHRPRHFDPLPVWYPPLEDESVDPDDFPLHAVTQRPTAMYHSWGSQNAWLRQIHGENPLYVAAPGLGARSASRTATGSGVVSPHGRIKRAGGADGGVRTPARSGPGTPSASAAGAWALDPDAPEATRGFLLNHLIPDRLPAGRVELRSGHRPGGLVRPARPPGARARAQPRRAGLSCPDLAGRPRS